MPDGGGGGSSYQTSNSNSMSTAAPPGQIGHKLEDNLDNFWYGYAQNNLNAPAFYPGQTYAGMSGDTGAGLSALAAQGNSGTNATLAAGMRGLNDTLAGSYLGGNPYLSRALEGQFGAQDRTFRDTVLPALDAKFAGAGRTGGGAHFNSSMRLADQMQRAQSDASASAVASEYGNERNRMLQASGMAPGLSGAQQQQALQNASALLQAGAGREGYDQKAINEAMARYNYGQTGQLDWSARIAQALQGMYPGGTTTSSGTSSGYMPGGGGGGAGSFLGPAMGVAGLGLQALPLFGVSDERMKEDIEPLGVDPLTGLPLYAYRYKNDPKTYPKVVGPMAQDIEEVAPHLVHEVNGTKVVNFGGLM